MPSVSDAVYKLYDSEIDDLSQNAMIQYLYRLKDSNALNYLRFAKTCEFFNSWQEDPWERQTFSAMPKRTELMNKAINFSENVQNKELKKRYAFLAIRLAWYNHHYDKVDSLFAATFEKTANKDILYYWSLYFKSFTKKDSVRANFELSQVFANAVDKRFVCHQYFNKNVSIEQVFICLRELKNTIKLYRIFKECMNTILHQTDFHFCCCAKSTKLKILCSLLITPYFSRPCCMIIGTIEMNFPFNKYSIVQSATENTRKRFYSLSAKLICAR
jgi:hypothetical protein